MLCSTTSFGIYLLLGLATIVKAVVDSGMPFSLAEGIEYPATTALLMPLTANDPISPKLWSACPFNDQLRCKAWPSGIVAHPRWAQGCQLYVVFSYGAGPALTSLPLAGAPRTTHISPSGTAVHTLGSRTAFPKRALSRLFTL